MDAPARICFVEVCTVDRDAYRGAALVTDGFADPLEFRCTSPVRPTRLQKVLWGGRLTGHLLVHVLGKPLVDALSAPPALVVVRQRLLLDLRKVAGLPAVQLLAAADDPGCRLLAEHPPPLPGAAAAPAYLRAADDRADDLDAAVRWLAPLAAAVHPAEPFARLLQAVAAVHQEETPVKAV